MQNFTATLKSLVEKSSHGKATNFDLPVGASLRGNKTVTDLGFALDAAIVQYMRDTVIPVPTLTAAFASGFGGAPLFSALAPDVHPGLAAIIISQGLIEKSMHSKLDLEQLIGTLAQMHRVEPDGLRQLVAAADEFQKRLTEKAFSRLIASIMVDGSSGKNGAEMIGAYAASPKLSWSTLESLFKVLAQLYGDLANEVPLESIAMSLPRMADNPEYAVFFNIYAGIRSLPIATTAMSLYSLYELHEKRNVGSSTVTTANTSIKKKSAKATREEQTAVYDDKHPLPVVRPIDYEGEQIDEGVVDLFGIDRAASKANRVQHKYWKITNPFAGKLDLTHVIQTALRFDRAVFGLPEYQIDLTSAVEVTAWRGAAVGLPTFPTNEKDLWDDEAIQRLLGYVCLKLVATDSGDHLTSTMLGFLKGYRLTDTNSHLPAKIEAHIGTIVAIFKTFCSFRNVMTDIIDRHEEFSMRVVNSGSTAVQLAGVDLMHLPTLKRYLGMYGATLENLGKVPIIDGSPNSLFHISRVLSVPRLFEVSISNLNHAIVLHPQTFMVGNTVSIRRPYLDGKDGKSYFLSSGPLSTPSKAAHSVMSAAARLASLTETHSVVHGFTESPQENAYNIEDLIRHIPLDVMTAFSSAGRAQAVLAPSSVLNMNLIVSYLISRNIVGFKTSLGLPSLQNAILGLAMPDTGNVLVETGDITDIIRRRYITSFTPSVVTNTDGADQSIFGLDSISSFIDTGSNNFVFLFEKQNMLYAEDAESLLDPASLSAPLFVMHESDFSGLSIFELMSDAKPAFESGADIEMRAGFSLKNKPAVESKKVLEQKTDIHTVSNVNDMVIKQDAPGNSTVSEEPDSANKDDDKAE